MAKLARGRVQASIDYPKAGEVVRHPSYTVRASVPGAAGAAVSVDNGGWQPCRESLGFWWYDWSGYGPGPHQLRVQALGPDGQILAVKQRSVTVAVGAPDDSGA